MKKPFFLTISGSRFREMVHGTLTAFILLFSLGLTGCDNDTGGYNISPRDAAIKRAEAWEKSGMRIS